MLRILNSRAMCVAILACALAACNGDSPTAPTPPGPPVTTPFSGTLTQNSAATHGFSPSAGGVVTATLTALGGGEGLVVGFSLGNQFGTVCSIVLANDNAAGGAVLSGTLTQAGPLCVRVYDVGNIQAGVTVPYAIEVVHP